MAKKGIVVEAPMSKTPPVSIVTITQLKRFPCIEILHDLIKDQDYTNIIEWVIVEGSKTEEDAKANADNIKGLKSTLTFPIVYIEWTANTKLGELRNRGNNACKGDITVAMDDDDYYVKERVSHAVDKLTSSKAQLAGCSPMYIYDYTLEKLYKFKGFGPNHSVNNAMAWKKSYLTNHQHDPMKETGEEPSFTNTFTEPMIQLDGLKTNIQSSHASNTFNKREILTGGTLKMNPTLHEISEPITNYIKEPYLSRFKAVFSNKQETPYDIIYMAGGFSPKWDPRDPALGGSEQAVTYLSSCWASAGKKVAVYGDVPEQRYKGVDYIDWKKFPFDQQHNTVILWRLFGLMTAGPFPLKAKQIILDLHEGTIHKQFVEYWFRFGDKVNKIMFRSNYHKETFVKHTHAKLTTDRFAIIPNGIRIEEFSKNIDLVPRNPYRLCFCADYTRGLVPILQYMWPAIYNAEPRAELHCYSGMEHIEKANPGWSAMITPLLAQPGVMHHGRQPMNVIIREKYMSNFHLYVTNIDESDCISIRESLVAGAIPLISSSSVFKERDGIHFEFDDKNANSYIHIGLKIVEFMRDPSMNRTREQLKNSQTIIPWTQIATRWLDTLNI